MIQAALGYLAFSLNQYLRRSHGSSEDLVALSQLVGLDGAPSMRVEGKLVLSLVNVERDTVPLSRKDGVANLAAVSPAASKTLFLNLHVLLAASCGSGNYGDFLRYLSNAIGYFQRHFLFDRENAPDLDPRLERLVVEPENLTISELSNLWGILGGKYLPSILYRVRMVAFSGDDLAGLHPAIASPEGKAAPA
jgi:hypothetical protein